MLAHPRIAIGLYLAALLADLAVWQLWQTQPDDLAVGILTLGLQTGQIGVLALVMILPSRLTVTRMIVCTVGILAFLVGLRDADALEGRLFTAGLVLALINIRLGRQFRQAGEAMPRTSFGLGTILLCMSALAAGLTIARELMQRVPFDTLYYLSYTLPWVVIQIVIVLSAVWATRAPTSLPRIALPFVVALLLVPAWICLAIGWTNVNWFWVTSGVLAATILTLSLRLIGFQYPTDSELALTASKP